MAEKLSIQIALQGGAEVERQLADIGKAGQQAFSQLEQSAAEVGGFKNLKPGQVTAELEKMGVKGTAAFGQIQDAVATASKFEKIVVGVQAVENGFAAAGRAALALAPVAGVAFTAIAAAAVSAAKSTIAFADSVNKLNNTAITLGGRGGIEELDRFRAGLEQAGVSAESIGQILQSKLATEQGVAGLDAFISSLSRMPDGAERSRAAVEHLGQAGAELIRILQAGGRLTGFGGTQGLINAQDAQKATQLGQAINQLESAIARLNTLGFAPALTTGINAATGAVEVLGARLQQTPWTTFLNAASLGLSPITSLISTVNGALTFLGGTVQQTGQKVQGGVQIWSQYGTALSMAGSQATVAVQGAGTAAQQAGQQVQGGVQIWSQYGTALSMAGGEAVKTVGAVNAAAKAASQPIPTQSWTDWANSAATAVDTIIAKLRNLLGLSRQTAPAAAAATGGGAPGLAGGGRIGGRGTGTSDSNLAWLSRGEYIMPARAVRQPGVLALLEALRRGRIPGFADGGAVGGGGGINILGEILRVGQENQQAIGGLELANQAMFNFLGQSNEDCKKESEKTRQKIADETPTDIFWESLFRVVQTASDGVIRLENRLGSMGPFAAGGLLGGRGTGISDSNLAWVSRGEHIMPARAVRQPGVLAFLETLRRSGGDLRRVLDGMGRFALGGMVPRAIPAFATGGLAGGMSNITIQFPGLPAIGGLRASSDVVDQLHRAAALAQVRSGGRKPSRYS